MPPAVTLPPALAAAVEAAVSIARRSPTTRVLLARTAGLLEGAPLPHRARAELDAAADAAVRPIEFARVERSLRSAWGRPASKVLDGLDREPLAVRAASQTHRGILDGEAVAVTVQRPGLAAAVRNDLVLLDALRAPLGAAFPDLDAGGVLREVREAAQDELDLEHVAATQRHVGRALRRTAGVAVPVVHGELAADEVLVTGLLDGPTLAAPGEPVDAERVARALIRAHVAAVLAAGVVPTDPRPGHVILQPGGDVGLLGLGVARPWPPERLRGLIDGLAALRDPEGAAILGETMERLGILSFAAGRDAHPVLRRVLGKLVTGPARLDHSALADLAERAARDIGALYGIAARATPLPSDVSAMRAVGQLVATLAVLGAEVDWGLALMDAAS